MRQGTITSRPVLLSILSANLFLFSFSARAIPPVVTITSPTNGSVLTTTAPVTFAATITDTNASVTIAGFFAGNTLLGATTHSPYSITVSNLAPGRFTLMAIADDSASTSGSNTITITVGSSNFPAAVAADIYSAGSVFTNGSMALGSNIRGALAFAPITPPPDCLLYLALNPYALPFTSNTVAIYGFDGGSGTFTGADFNAGTYLGSMTFPTNINFGQVATFEVTQFVRSAKGPYFGFILRGGGDLSTLTDNYGTPPEIVAALSPLPPALSPNVISNQMVISWTTNNAAGLTLQSTTNPAGGGWTPVGITPTQNGGQLVVTNPASGPQQFFRLSNH